MFYLLWIAFGNAGAFKLSTFLLSDSIEAGKDIAGRRGVVFLTNNHRHHR